MHWNALECTGMQECISIMKDYLVAQECTVVMRVHLDHGSALQCQTVHLGCGSTLGCMKVHLDHELTWMHDSAQKCTRVHLHV